MKRILLPLLAALALPTAINANWLSGDIVETNAVGEKTIVKKGTIRLEKNTVNDSYEGYKYILNMYKKGIVKDQERIIKAKKEYAECLAERSYCEGRKENIEIWKDSLKRNKRRLQESTSRYQPILLKYENFVFENGIKTYTQQKSYRNFSTCY